MKNLSINIFGGIALIVLGAIKVIPMIVVAIPVGILILGLTIAEWLWSHVIASKPKP